MANKGAQLALLITLVWKINVTLGQLIEGKAIPTRYVSFPPSTYDDRGFNVPHNIGNCITSEERVDNRDADVITCPYGELLLDNITETNLEDDVSNSDIQTFYTWQEDTIPIREAFITLQFPGEPITPTRVVVYCLELRELRADDPSSIELFSSTTESIFPEDEIRDVDDNEFTVTRSGETDEDDDYEYRRYDLIIPENRQVALNYLRISLDFDRNDWVFISEVEVYHLFEPPPTTTTQVTTTTRQVSTTIQMTTTSSMIVLSSTAATTTSSAAIETTSSILTPSSAVSSSSVSTMVASTTTAFPTPNFIFPRVNNVALLVTELLSDLTINCTVMSEGDPSQLTTLWSYNGLGISSNDKYIVNGSQLTIRNFTSQDTGAYTCTVQHQSGWASSRQYSITTNTGGNVAQEPGTGSDSSSGLPIAVVAAAAGGAAGLLLCVILTVCCIVCCYRRKRAKDKEQSNSGAEKSSSLFRPYEYVDEGLPPESRKRSIDNVYEHTNSLNSSTKGDTEDKHSNPPTLPRFPKFFSQPKIPELPKPHLPPKPQKENEDVYEFLGEYIEMSTSLSPSHFPHNDNEICFNIYDDTVITPALQSPQDIYEPLENPEEVMQSEVNNMTMCLPIYDEPSPLTRDEAPKMVEWDNISILTNIGEGQFGDVFLAETIGIDAVELGCTDTKATRILVAIKTLKGDYSAGLKKQFEKEIKFMARLDNDNVIRLLGICNKGTPFIMIEYMKNGDLHMFLKKHYHPEIGRDTETADIQVDIPILLYMGLQIANGMRYLASIDFIHRDLAARNCLVGEDYIVKVADFGMTQSLYNTSYFCMRGTALVPIRWMAPESFFGRFSTKTDVWSYGVTLWEIFTLCRQQPYGDISDEDFVYSAQKAQDRVHLKRPLLATDEVFNIMKKCWTFDENQRPNFDSVYDQLFNYYMQIQ